MGEILYWGATVVGRTEVENFGVEAETRQDARSQAADTFCETHDGDPVQVRVSVVRVSVTGQGDEEIVRAYARERLSEDDRDVVVLNDEEIPVSEIETIIERTE